MARGIKPRALGPLNNDRVNAGVASFGIPFEVMFTTDASTSTYDWENDSGRVMRVSRAYGYMTGAGASSDTAAVQRVRSGSATAITDTADLSVMSDTDQFDFSQINDAANDVSHGDTLRLATASGALCVVFVQGFWRES